MSMESSGARRYSGKLVAMLLSVYYYYYCLC